MEIIDLEENRKLVHKSQYFMGKILETFNLRMTATLVRFSSQQRKILNAKQLSAEGSAYRLQDIDSGGLTGKILKTMDLDPLECETELGIAAARSRSCRFSDRNLKI